MIKIIIRFFLLISLVVFLVTPKVSLAAIPSLIMSGKNSSTIGSSEIVNVVVSSDSSINTISGEIIFDSSRARVDEILLGGSIIDLWIESPIDSSGRISFSGIVFNPGFVGSEGNMFSIRYTPLAVGLIEFRFTRGGFLANDGLGTSVAGGTIGMDVVVNPGAFVPEEVIPVVNPDNNSSEQPSGGLGYNSNRQIIEEAIEALNLNEVDKVDVERLTSSIPTQYVVGDSRVLEEIKAIEEEKRLWRTATTASGAVNIVSFAATANYWIRFSRLRRLASLIKGK